MKKLLFILLVLPVLCFAQDAKEKATKMDAFASQTGMIIKLSDFSLPSIPTSFGVASAKIRIFETGAKLGYFYQISNKGQYSTKTASIAYEDFLEIFKAFESLKSEALIDIDTNPEYLEKKFKTSDGFEIGYYIQKSKISWFLTLTNLGSDNTLFMKDVKDIQATFDGAKAKFEELKAN